MSRLFFLKKLDVVVLKNTKPPLDFIPGTV